MRYLAERIQGICDNLEKLSIKQKADLYDWKYKEGTYLTRDEADNDTASPWLDFDTKSMHWYGKDRHYWFNTTLTVPSSFDNKSLWLKICTQIDEWDDGKNPQFLLFINGEIIQGVDMNHREILISEKAKAGDTYQIDIQSYTGILHTEFNFIAYLFERDTLINKLFWDLTVPLHSFKRLPKESQDKFALTKVLNDTINILDLREPYNDSFYETLQKASDFIDKALYEDLSGYDRVIASCIGHTHIDVAWWWTVEQTREKVCRSFATVLKLMDEYPNYRFMSSQPQLYAFVKERYPKLYSKIVERVKEGRWEVEGGMWVEADCNIPSGESFVRQFIYGMDFFEKEFNKDNRILWLPDVFGYSAALPQIMKRVGVDYFMTTKLNWNQWNKFPHDTFNWKGIDGSSVLTHLITTQEEHQNPNEDFFTTYNGKLHPGVLLASWDRYQDKDINNDILISYGYGDGGGGPTRRMLENSKRLEKGIVGIPKVRQVSSRTYFEELDERLKDNNRLASWEGELYFEYHRGTYTSMARNKRSNRKTEFALMNCELFSVLSEASLSYPKAQLDEIWKLALRNQFHDILPGSSIKEVYEVTKKEYKEIGEQVATLTNDRIKTLCSDEEGLTLFNTSSFDRDDIIEIDRIEAECLLDSNGIKSVVQNSGDKSIVEVKSLPSKGYRSYSLIDDTLNVENTFKITDNSIETDLYKIEFDENALITGYFDKEEEREVIQSCKKANLFKLFEDKPIYYDNWDIDIFYTEKSWDVTSLTKFEWIEKGPLRATLLIEREISKSRIVQKIHFYYNKKRVDFETYVDYKEAQHLLKVFFPTSMHSDEATYDIQFGNLKRKTHSNTSWDEARFESCAHKYIDVSEGHYGVSLMNDCKYGHSVKNGEMALTLIKTGIEPNPTTDQEEHFFTYSFMPHAEGLLQSDTTKEAYFLNQPVIAYNKKSITPEFSLVSCDKNNVIIETVKKAEDGKGTIIRLYENENSLVKANLKINLPFEKAYLCNLRENIESEIETSNGEVSFKVKPYEIVTLKLL